MIRIRTSILATYNDCPRRSMLRLSKDRDDNGKPYQNFIESLGYETRKRCKIVSAAVGTALHTGAREIMETVKITKERGSLKESQDLAVEKFKVTISDGVLFDNQTANRNEGEQQTLALVRSYYHEIAPNIKPVLVEEYMEAQTGDVFLTGHTDIIELDTVRDSKTGRESNASAQIGGYSLLSKADKGMNPIYGAIDYLPRTPLSKTYPGAKTIKYDLHICEVTAWHTMMNINNHYKEFVKTENPNIIPANPLSILCSPKWCEAANTEFCKLCMR